MDNKVVVITGGSSGIGATLARLLGKKGYKIALAARRKKVLDEVASSIGNNAIGIEADVTKRQDVEKIKDEAIKAFGHIDVWINNAGRGISRQVLELTDEEIDEVLAVNLKSAIYGMQTIVPYFQEVKKGHLINISSFLSRVPVATFRSIYSASKAALNSLTANLRMVVQKENPNIHISLVLPAMVLTEFHKNAIGESPQLSKPPKNAPNPQTADEVAAAIESVIENPRYDTYTNPPTAEIAKNYYSGIEEFEKKFL